MSLTRSHATRTGACDGLFARQREGVWHCVSDALVVGRPGGDLLSRVLGRSTIGAEGFHGRVRDGIGCIAPRNDHQVVEQPVERCPGFRPGGRCEIESMK
jgi:hypothetical protein